MYLEKENKSFKIKVTANIHLALCSLQCIGRFTLTVAYFTAGTTKTNLSWMLVYVRSSNYE
jgi:hypothetical protein